MFTSRAEFRILLRHDNADLRLTAIGHEIGLASNERLERVSQKIKKTEAVIAVLKKLKVSPTQINTKLKYFNSADIKEKTTLHQLLKRPEIAINQLPKLSQDFSDFCDNAQNEILEQASIQIKYKSYIEKEKNMAEKLSDIDSKIIPLNFNYHGIPALSYEAKEKLTNLQPTNLGQASRVSGVNPADISVLMVYMAR
jgi:tRNA uridine 5-carboxymethylaminomethyl modification enzyme